MTARNIVSATYYIFSWAAAFLFPLLVFTHSLPTNWNDATLVFSLRFFTLAFFLTVAMFGLGNVSRRRLLKADFGQADIALGFGIFALFLRVCSFISISPILPAFVAALGFICGLMAAKRSWRSICSFMAAPTTPWLVCTGFAALSYLSFRAQSNGLLYIPFDYDSDLMHVALPRAIVQAGHYILPDWLRAPWHPQLTHLWYVFLLMLADIFYLKTVNVLVLVQLFVLFAGGRTFVSRALGLLLFSTLTVAPEFSEIATSTYLDAVLSMFCTASFVLFVQLMQKPKFRDLCLATILCGFASGQKHFGLMFSAPLLVIAVLRYAAVKLETLWDRERGLQMNLTKRETIRLGYSCLSLVLLFSATFVPFYIHNWVSGNSLLFPFFGSTENTYGWSAADLKELMQSTIPRWGHAKSFSGFFLIPVHLLKFPEEYQFFYFSRKSPYDWMISVEIVSLFVGLILGLIVPRLRSTAALAPFLLLFIHLFEWYKGSQVVRYLFPFSINVPLLFVWQVSVPSIRSFELKKRTLTALICGLLIATGILQLHAQRYRPVLPLPTRNAEVYPWLKAHVTPQAALYNFLKRRVKPDQRVLNLAPMTGSSHFPEVKLCGDWFATCRYDRYIDGNMRFKDWADLLPEVRKNNFSYIIVRWDLLSSRKSRPQGEELKDVFPPSTFECLQLSTTDGNMTDVFRIRRRCR